MVMVVMDEIAGLKALLAEQAKALAAMDEKVDSVATDIANFPEELAVIQDQVSEAAAKPAPKKPAGPDAVAKAKENLAAAKKAQSKARGVPAKSGAKKRVKAAEAQLKKAVEAKKAAAKKK